MIKKRIVKTRKQRIRIFRLIAKYIYNIKSFSYGNLKLYFLGFYEKPTFLHKLDSRNKDKKTYFFRKKKDTAIVEIRTFFGKGF